MISFVVANMQIFAAPINRYEINTIGSIVMDKQYYLFLILNFLDLKIGGKKLLRESEGELV